MNVTQIKKSAEMLFFGVLAGALIVGCGGGAGGGTGVAVTTPSASTTPVGSYIADGQGTSFDGWWLGPTSAQSAVVATGTLAATTPTVFAITDTPKLLSGSTWSNGTLAPPSGYDLAPAGWTLSTNTGMTFVDSGNGINAAVNKTNGASYQYSFAKTNLAGATFASTGITTLGSYTTGASEYIMTLTAPYYHLSPGTVPANAITGASGIALSVLPALGVTFCDPTAPAVVYQGMGLPTPSANYNVYNTTSCSSGNITTALGTAPIATVLISLVSTGNTAVPNVLRLSNAIGSAPPAWMNNSIYGVQAGYVWWGVTYPIGTSFVSKNKIAINQELVASGLPAIP